MSGAAGCAGVAVGATVRGAAGCGGAAGAARLQRAERWAAAAQEALAAAGNGRSVRVQADHLSADATGPPPAADVTATDVRQQRRLLSLWLPAQVAPASAGSASERRFRAASSSSTAAVTAGVVDSVLYPRLGSSSGSSATARQPVLSRWRVQRSSESKSIPSFFLIAIATSSSIELE